MPDPSYCTERLALSQKVTTATAALYTARGKYDNRNAANADALQLVLSQARTTERAAVKTFNAHVKEHGCER